MCNIVCIYGQAVTFKLAKKTYKIAENVQISSKYSKSLLICMDGKAETFKLPLL